MSTEPGLGQSHPDQHVDRITMVSAPGLGHQRVAQALVLTVSQQTGHGGSAADGNAN